MSAAEKPDLESLLWATTIAGITSLFLMWAPVAGAGEPAAKDGNEVPLWRRATEEITRNSQYWAAGVNSNLTVYDEAGRFLGSVETQDELEMTEGRPVWKQVSRVKKGQPGMVITLDLNIQKKPGLVLKAYDVWTLLRKEVLAGVPVEVWQGVETAEPGNTATAYLNAATARPLQIVFTMPFNHPLMGKRSLSLTVEYKETAAGACLPARTVVDQTASVFLEKRRIHIESEYRDWRPVSAAAPVRAPST